MLVKHVEFYNFDVKTIYTNKSLVITYEKPEKKRKKENFGKVFFCNNSNHKFLKWIQNIQTFYGTYLSHINQRKVPESTKIFCKKYKFKQTSEINN